MLSRFNGAAVFRPRKLKHIHMLHTARGPCFNGAAVFRPRKPLRRCADGCRHAQASTEPRSFDRGNVRDWALLTPRPGKLQRSRGLSTAETTGSTKGFPSPKRCFNGAAVFRPRKHRVPSGERGAQRPRFNGAAVFRPRKRRASRISSRRCSPLQRSRGLSTAETQVVAALQREGKVLLQRSRGLSTAETLRRRTRRCAETTLASTEPRSFDRGNSPTGRKIAAHRSKLQRSRGLSTAETSTSTFRPTPRCCFNGAAVFRPRKLTRSSPATKTGNASTEPRSFDRGNNNAAIGAAPQQLKLQRSRGLSTAETLALGYGCGWEKFMLQRSRGLSTAETQLSWRLGTCRRRRLQRSRGLSTAETRIDKAGWRWR